MHGTIGASNAQCNGKIATRGGAVRRHIRDDDRGGSESTHAWRLIVTLLLSAIGGVGMWSVVVALPAVQAEFGVARADALACDPAHPYMTGNVAVRAQRVGD